MAAAIATPTVPFNNQITLGNKYQVAGTLAISANPATYTTGGIACNLNTSNIKASRTPVAVTLSQLTGFEYAYVPGTDNSNGKFKIFVQDAVATNPLLEMANGTTIPAAVSGDTINFLATYTGQN